MGLLNERIKDMRIKHGYTLAYVAELLGIKEATMQRYESGEIKNIKHETISKLAEIYNCSPAYLMGWEKSKSIKNLLAENIKKYRNSMGVSQATVSEYTKIPEKTIDDFENGTANPSMTDLEKLADAFNISVKMLLDIPDASESDLIEGYIASRFKSNGYSIFHVHVHGSDKIWLISEEGYIEIDEQTFSSFISSIENYIDFSINNILEKFNLRQVTKTVTAKSTYLETQAAHERTDIEVTGEMRKHDDDLMNNDDLWK